MIQTVQFLASPNLPFPVDNVQKHYEFFFCKNPLYSTLKSVFFPLPLTLFSGIDRAGMSNNEEQYFASLVEYSYGIPCEIKYFSTLTNLHSAISKSTLTLKTLNLLPQITFRKKIRLQF